MSISELSLLPQSRFELGKTIRLQLFSELLSPEVIVNRLISIEGPLDIYFWYEGSRFLPSCGALFMKEKFLIPLQQKEDAKVYLYSLKAWNFSRNMNKTPSTTPLGESINRINKAAIECIYSSAFFQYCTRVKENNLYEFVRANLRKKEWLCTLSATQKKIGITVGAFFNEAPSLFDCIKDLDVSSAYSYMQYIEGYYLIREAVQRRLLKGQKKIEVAFVLPNDESKYYVDLPDDIETMLTLDFGKDLLAIQVSISFYFFPFGESITARPYIDKRPGALRVKPEEIRSYFKSFSQQPKSMV